MPYEPKPVNEVKVAQKYFYDSFRKKFNVVYTRSFGRDRKLLKDMLLGRTLEDLKNIIDLFFASDSKFVKKAGYTINILKNEINKLSISQNQLSPLEESDRIRQERIKKAEDKERRRLEALEEIKREKEQETKNDKSQ